MFDKTERRIFISFFFIYSIFIFWTGTDDESRFVLTRAVVDQGRFEIDYFCEGQLCLNMIDRAVYNGHYYSDKEPGVSFVGIPVYSAIEIFFEFVPTASQFLIPLSKILLVVFASVLPSCLLLILLFRVTHKFGLGDAGRRTIVVIATGVGTLIFPYSLVYLSHSISTCLCFLSFYLLLSKKKEYVKFAGLSLGFAIVCSFESILVGFILLVYLFMTSRENVAKYVVYLALGVAPLLLYNVAIFGTPLTLPRLHMDPLLWSNIGGFAGMGMPDLFVVLRLLFYPFKGLFFYYPVLVFFIPGLICMWRENKKIELFVVVSVFVSFIFMNSSWYAWWGHASFGPRLLTITTPFLILPISMILKRMNLKSWLIFSVLLSYSVLVNFSGVQPPRDFVIGQYGPQMLPEYKEKLYSLEVIANPILDYNMPLFVRYGPRSRIVEDITNLEFPDISFEGANNIEYPLLNTYYSFLPLVLLSFALMCTWRNSAQLRLIFSSNRRVFTVTVLILSYLYLVYLSWYNTTTGWYPTSSSETGFWMGDEGSIPFFSYGKKYLSQFTFASYSSERNVNLSLNNVFIDSFKVMSNSDLEYSFLLDTQPGSNFVRFDAEPMCESPHDVESTNDTRCLSIHLWNYTIEEFNGTWSYGKYWYPQAENEEGRWMAQNATIDIVIDQPTQFNITVWSMLIDRQLNIYTDDQLLTTLHLENNTKLTYSSPAITTPSTLRFETIGDCIVPASIENGWEDYRCLGVQLSDITSSTSNYWS